MRLMRIFTNYLSINGDEHVRQYRLIHYITVELVIASLIIVSLYTFIKLWYLVAVIGLGSILALINLWLLGRTRNTVVCGHIITLVIFLTVFAANYLVRGIGASYSLWFYVIPVLASSLIGWLGFFIYTPLTLLMILGFGAFTMEPFYHLPAEQLLRIDRANHLFAYVIMVTTLVNLMRENNRYEQLLREKNQLLQCEKEKYQYLARFDPLTNLPNRQYFKQYLQEGMVSLAPQACLTVFFMDLDNFKYINDAYGHEKGDLMLLQVARRLQLCFRKDDFVARLGGDEFTAIFVHALGEEAKLQAIAEGIIKAFETAFMIGEQSYYCAISIGCATYPTDAKTAPELMHQADLAMYVAKKKQGSAYYSATGSVL